MSLLELAKKLQCKNESSIKAREKWVPLAAKNENDINILGEIGDDWTDSDTTLDRVQRKLKASNGGDVVVNINSFGGSMFEGVAIYNALRQHEGKVTVKTLGIAASAASLIAMAGDEIHMAESSFLMIHNSWTFAVGNRYELASLCENMEKFDDVMAGIYSDRMMIKKDRIQEMMDDEYYMPGTEAIEAGFALNLFENDFPEGDGSVIAAHKVDLYLAKQGVPRSQRRELIKDIKGMHDATQNSTQNATDSNVLALLKEMASKFD